MIQSLQRIAIFSINAFVSREGKVNINLLQRTQTRQATSEALRHMARTKQRSTYLP